jgi:hypothetical protein
VPLWYVCFHLTYQLYQHRPGADVFHSILTHSNQQIELMTINQIKFLLILIVGTAVAKDLEQTEILMFLILWQYFYKPQCRLKRYD